MKSFTTNIPLYYNSSNLPSQNSLPVVKKENNSHLSSYTNEKDPFREFNSKCTKSGNISHPNSNPDFNTSSLNMKLKQKLMSISSNSQASNLASPKLTKLDNLGEVANSSLKYGNILHSTLKDKVEKNNRIHVKNDAINTNRNINNEVNLNPSHIKNNIKSKIKTNSNLENLEKSVKTINLINDNNTTKFNNYNENDKKISNEEKTENQIKFILKSNDPNQSNENGDNLTKNNQINKINLINIDDNCSNNLNFAKNNQSNSTIKILNIQETNQLNDTPKNYLANKRAINKKVNKNEEIINQEKFDYNFKPNQIKMDASTLIQSNSHTNIPISQDVSLNEKNCNKINIENNSNTSNTSSIIDEQSSASKSKKNFNSKSNTNNYSNNRNDKKPNQYSYNELSSNKLSNSHYNNQSHSNNTNNSNYNSSKPKNYNSILSIKIKNMSYKEVDSFYNSYIPILPHQIFEKKMEN